MVSLYLKTNFGEKYVTYFRQIGSNHIIVWHFIPIHYFPFQIVRILAYQANIDVYLAYLFRKLLPIFSFSLEVYHLPIPLFLSLSLSLSFHIFLQNIESHKTTPWTRKVFVHMLSNFICMDNFVQQSVKNKFFSSPL